MNLLYYPKDVVKKALESYQVEDYESDDDLYDDEEDQPSNLPVYLDSHSISKVHRNLRFYIVIDGLPNQRIPISLDGEEDMKYFETQVSEMLQFKLDFLNGLTISSLIPREELPKEGPIKDAITENDVLHCSLETRDIWVKCIIIMAVTNPQGGKQAQTQRVRTEMSIKLNLKHYLEEFKNIIQKLTYCIWNKFCYEEYQGKNDSYVLTDIDYELSQEGLDFLWKRQQMRVEKKLNQFPSSPDAKRAVDMSFSVKKGKTKKNAKYGRQTSVFNDQEPSQKLKRNIIYKFYNSEGTVGDFFGFPLETEYVNDPTLEKKRKRERKDNKDIAQPMIFEEKNALVNMFLVKCTFEPIQEVFQDFLNIGINQKRKCSTYLGYLIKRSPEILETVKKALGYHEPKNSKFEYCKDVHVDMEFVHGDKAEELKLSESYSKLKNDFQEHADNMDRTLDLSFRMFGNILVKYDKQHEASMKKNSKHYDYEHEFIEKLQNQKKEYHDLMIKDSIVEEEGKLHSESHEERFDKLKQLMKEETSEYTDPYDDGEPTIAFYPGEREFKNSIMEHQKRDLDSLYTASFHHSFIEDENRHTQKSQDSPLLISRGVLSGAPSMMYRDSDSIENFSGIFDEVRTQRNSLGMGFLKKENESEVKLKRLIHVLAEKAITCCYPGSISSDYPLSIQFRNDGSQMVVDHTSCELVVDFLNLISKKTPTLEIHQMSFAHLPEIKDFKYKAFNQDED
ncbi:unnamed protein product [Moneuplotes crassus]|uniref:Uncharacterized protein n=1 Tax=Euplotes crassus TaxID=5936 RepID=A0AAD1Y7L9_EUPCR|nr:unnamed protein product [Moneuplotes crassus]